jgi:hypothetical protein
MHQSPWYSILIAMAEASGPFICTKGRSKGDVGQPTCRGSSRTKHFLLSPELYGLQYQVEALHNYVTSDHTPLRTPPFH